jgi:hypothetical protein
VFANAEGCVLRRHKISSQDLYQSLVLRATLLRQCGVLVCRSAEYDLGSMEIAVAPNLQGKTVA